MKSTKNMKGDGLGTTKRHKKQKQGHGIMKKKRLKLIE